MANAATKAVGKDITEEMVKDLSGKAVGDAAKANLNGLTDAEIASAKSAMGTHGLSAAQKALGGAAAAYSLYDLGDTFYKHYNNNRSSSEILAGSGRATQTNEGVEYTNYTGFDTNAERKLEHT